MTPTHALRLLSLAGLGSLFALTSLAQEGGYYYGGLSVGQSRAKIDEERITAGLLAAGLRTTAMARDESDTAYKLFGGYQFNRHFALEAGYFNLGEFGFTSTTTPAGQLDGRIKLQGLNLDLVGTLPLGERWSAIARVGAHNTRARDSFTGGGAVSVANPNPSKRETNFKLGAGLQYAFSPSFLVRAEAERYRINDAVGNRGDVNMFSVSLVVPFGRTAAPAARTVAAPADTTPAYVAPAPAPAPTVAQAPAAAPAPTPERRRVSFSTDSLFGFDESTVRPEGKSALDDVVRQIGSTRVDVITVEGHTDRLGSPSYNQRLSLQRAESVKAYLVRSGGVDAAKVSAVGRGESMPITQPDDCQARTVGKADAKLIACLQPDRRVEVEVAGTR